MGRHLAAREIDDLRYQRAQGIDDDVLAASWRISPAAVGRLAAKHGERDAQIRASKASVADLARMYGLSTAHVSRIRKGIARPPTPREELAAVAAGGWRADCMDDEEWAHWVATNPTGMKDSELAPRPCTDCPLGFAADMRAQGKCNGTPGWQAPAEDEEELMTADTDPRPRVIPNGTEVVVVLEAPCGRCAHEPVCAIKRSLESIDTLPVSVPRFDKALTVGLTAKVDCSQFMALPKAKRTLNLTDEERQRRGEQIRRVGGRKPAAAAS